MKKTTTAVVAGALLAMGLTACGGGDANAKACQSIKDNGFDSVAGPLYDAAGKSLQKAIDKVDADVLPGSLYGDVVDLNKLCSKYGVDKAFAQ